MGKSGGIGLVALGTSIGSFTFGTSVGGFTFGTGVGSFALSIISVLALMDG